MVHETRTARAARGSGRVRARLVITLIGIAALVAGAFLDWHTTQPGYRLTFRSLLHDDFATTSHTTQSVGAISILIAAFALLALLDRTGWLTRLAGLAAVVLFAMFALQLYRHSGQHFDPALRAVRAGAWCTVGAGVLLLLGGLVRYRPKRRRAARDAEQAALERDRLSADTAVQRPVPNEPIGEADRAGGADSAATVELGGGGAEAGRVREPDRERAPQHARDLDRELAEAERRQKENADL